MNYASIIALLKTALLLLSLAQGPRVPQTLHDQAVSVANQAIAAATVALATTPTNSTATGTAPTASTGSTASPGSIAAPAVSSNAPQTTSSGNTTVVTTTSTTAPAPTTSTAPSQTVASVTTSPSPVTPTLPPAGLAYVNVVKDFGAKGDGVTNDTNAIYQALSYGAKNNVGVFFPAQTYAVDPIVISNTVPTQYDFAHIGDNVPLFVTGIGAKLVPAANAYPPGTALLTVENPQGVRPDGFVLAGLTVDARNVLDYGIVLHGGQKAILTQLEALHANKYGVQLVGEAGYGIYSSLLEGVFSDHNAGGGIEVTSRGSDGATRLGTVQFIDVHGNFNAGQSGTTGYGFHIDTVGGIDCFNCSAEENGKFGLLVEHGSSGIRLDDSYFELNGGYLTGAYAWNAVGADTPYHVDLVSNITLDGRVIGSTASETIQPNTATPTPFSKFSWAEPIIAKAYQIPTAASVNVDTYGARGDGSSDDTAAINATIAYAAQHSLGVSFSAGKTYLTQGIAINGMTTPHTVPLFVMGNGATLRRTGASKGGQLFFVTNPQAIRNRFLVSDFNLDCNSLANYGFEEDGGQFVTIKNISAYHCNDAGVFIYGASGKGFYYSTLQNISSHDNVYSGMLFLSPDAADNANGETYIAADGLLGLSSYSNGSYGYKVRWASLRCDNCTAQNNAAYGIDGEASRYLYFVGSSLSGNGASADPQSYFSTNVEAKFPK